ncbi:hypothetical protein C0991_006734 [Blastosporella zonata]|nr:hypothetical protein C0991_006734 [Blastosporella zonata]
MARQLIGSAVYVYCVQPLGIPLASTALTTFFIDNEIRGTFLPQGSDQPSSYLPSANIFSQAGLPETPHVLQVNVGLNSIFLFDYLIYTHTEQTTINSTNIATSVLLPQDLLASSQSVNSYVSMLKNTKKNNIATFAGAIGGSVGVLALLALGLAFSIIKRRRNYERRERAALQSDDSPRMIGPRPFVPRFFPGTNPDPPPYVESTSGSTSDGSYSLSPSHETPQMRSSELVPVSRPAHIPGQESSYADIPPSTPPPRLDDAHLLTPPPPFGAAIASTPASISEAERATPSDVSGTDLEPHQGQLAVETSRPH